MTHSSPAPIPARSAVLGKRRAPKTLMGPLVALAVLGLLFIAVGQSKALVPAAWAPGLSFGATSFYALYPDPRLPDRAQVAVVNVRIWARGQHVRTGLRMDLWWEGEHDGGPLADRTPWKSLPDSLKQAARRERTPVLLETRAEADEWIWAELVAAMSRTMSEFPAMGGASNPPPPSQRPTTYVVKYLDRMWLERLLGWHAAVNAVLYGGGGLAIVWLLVRIEAQSHARSLARRGLCVACGYSRAGISLSAVCPECGKAP